MGGPDDDRLRRQSGLFGDYLTGCSGDVRFQSAQVATDEQERGIPVPKQQGVGLQFVVDSVGFVADSCSLDRGPERVGDDCRGTANMYHV